MLIGKDKLADNSGSYESYGALEGASINLPKDLGGDGLEEDFTLVDDTDEGSDGGEEEKDTRTFGQKMKDTMKAMTPFDWIRVILVLLLVAAVLIIGGLALLPNSPVLAILQEILNWIQSLPRWLAGILMIELFALVIPIGCPITPLNLVSGFLFDLWFGYLIAITGTLLGSVVCYMWSLTLVRDWAEAKLKSKRLFRAIEHGTHENSMKLIILTHLSPVMPTSILNYLFATMGVDFIKFLVATFLGVTPLMFIAIYVGSLSADLAEALDGSETPAWEYLLSILLVVVTSIILIVLLGWIGKREVGRAMKEIDRKDEIKANVTSTVEAKRAAIFLREESMLI
mmetsp:Transcript_14862/g.58289  ORF Transcript_14862/g.58289 Transcript_14862/m.58289 type:complete len:342 (+) Transcript_14862:55-1080(+)